MSEFVTLPPSTVISTVIQDWLQAEKLSSLVDNNAGLNRHDTYVASEVRAWDDPENAFTQKSLGHYNRLRQRTSELSEESVGDKFIALQMFDALMTLSGHHRLQCVVRAKDQEQYMGLRYNTPSFGLNIPERVEKRLSEQFHKFPRQKDLSQRVVGLSDLKLMATTANENRLGLMRELFDGKRIFGTRRAIYAGRLVASQALWLDTAVDHIVYAAQEHDGDLQQVPFLEPKSITFAEMVYPLAGEPPYFTEQPEEA